MDAKLLFYIVPGAGLLAIIFAAIKARGINAHDMGTDRMKEIAGYIREGAMAFLRKEYSVLSIFTIVVAALLAVANWSNPKSHVIVALSFVLGALCSAAAGFFGMRVATAANVRTTNAARKGLNDALKIAFSGGTVMGMTVVGLGVLGLSLLFLVYWKTGMMVDASGAVDWPRLVSAMAGFSMGASSIALFARVGGGIYTKAADVGADLVGKVAKGIPEDDPRNPAVIADNVGDNVGDVAGMGADLFESYVGAIIAAMVLGAASLSVSPDNMPALFLPLILSGGGILVSIIGTFFVRTKEGGNPQTALNTGTFLAGFLMIVLTGLACYFLIPKGLTVATAKGPLTYQWFHLFIAVVAGLIAGILIGLTTEYYTSESRSPARQVAKESETGASTNIIAGLALGMKSTAIPVLLIAAGIVVAYLYGGLYGIALAALGMLSTTGIQLAVDAYGPIADNAGGIAEMSELEPSVRKRTDKLDAVGNTTAAVGKGFAIGSAALTALALFSAFMETANISTINVNEPIIMAGLMIGAMLPFVFSAMSMKAVGSAASEMIKEVLRQFDEIPGLEEGTAKADHARCVEIATGAAIKRMIVPGLLAIIVPVIAGFINKTMLGGLLVGVTVSGVLLAIFMANAGGAWDNAKKYIEGGAHGGKGSDPHKAAVVGDTVGDPFKDTAGPSLNILIKLVSVVSLVIAAIL